VAQKAARQGRGSHRHRGLGGLLGQRSRVPTPTQLLPPRPAAGRRLTLRQEMAEGLLLVARDSFLRQLSIPAARHQT
jgi:hypothetical protein